MPEVTVCTACGGTGKIESERARGSSDEAAIFLLCRTCNGSGWVTTPAEGEEAGYAKGSIDVKAEINAIDSNIRSGDLAPYLKLLIRLIDERFPLKRDE